MRLVVGLVMCAVCWAAAEEESVWPPPYMTVPSEEVDSSEHGGPPGPVPTTCPCGHANKGMGRIVAGEEAGWHEFPFTVSLKRRKSDTPFCGGSLVTLRHVLTAAHCVFKKAAETLLVTAGDHDFKNESSPNRQRYGVQEIVIHEEYEHLKYMDIALVVLEKPVELNRHVAVVCLPSGPLNLDGVYLTAIGWGRIGWQKGVGQSPVLKKMKVRGVPIAQCAKFTTVDLAARRQLCTYGRMRGLSQGDSGGPIVWLDPNTNRYTLVGIPSFVYPFLSENYKPDVTTDVSAFLPWIHREINRTDRRYKHCQSTK